MEHDTRSMMMCSSIYSTPTSNQMQDDIIVEYDTRSMSPIGLVCMDMPDDCTARLVDAAGQEVDALNTGGLICG